MKITIIMENPHDPKKPTCLVNETCKTLDEAAQAVYFFYEYCRIIKVSVVDGNLVK